MCSLRLPLLALFLVSLVPPLQARIGESRSTIERRLFDSGGIVYRDDAIEQARMRGKPYLGLFPLMPDSTELRIYFKTADGRSPSSTELDARRMGDGWDLHVLYVGGKSVLELYERSQGMTDHEFNQLLAVHAGGSYWKRVKRGEATEPSVLGYDMVRDDGAVRAKRLGGTTLLLIDPDLDNQLAEMQEAKRQENAPVSVEGF